MKYALKLLNIKISLVVLLLIAIAPAHGQVQELWSKGYSKFMGNVIEPVDLKIDHLGNVYVAFKSFTSMTTFYDDYHLIKYSPQGDQLWVKSYNGPKNTNDVPSHLALDAEGNAYITGYSNGLGQAATDFCTIKYSPDGQQLWVARHDSPQGNDNKVAGLFVDEAGNVFITGNAAHESTANSGMDFYTVKYNTQGQKEWGISYDRNITSDYPGDIVVDGKGNVMVAGNTNGPAYDITVLKYAGKKLLWSQHYAGPSKSNPSNVSGNTAVASAEGIARGPGQDIANKIVTDEQGNIYVAGYSHGSNSAQDYVLLKYDAQGQRQWVQRYSGPARVWDEIEQLALDSQGNIIVSGFSGLNDRRKTYAYCTIKFNPDGEQLWVRKTDSKRTDAAHYLMPDMVIDHQDNIYVTGGDLHGKFYTVKYDSQGNKQWEVTSGFLGGGSFALDVDDENNVVVTGFTVSQQLGIQLLTVKYAQD